MTRGRALKTEFCFSSFSKKFIITCLILHNLHWTSPIDHQQSLSLFLLKKTKFFSVCNKGFLHLLLIDENAHNFVTERISKFPFSLSPNHVKLFIITQYLVARRISSKSNPQKVVTNRFLERRVNCFFFVDFTYR